ncbi:transmembrane transport protein [Nocardiopsis sp. FIRDI 009]|uniref:transmembrane transport protein n=1 Tax=Nocardiopsis sp. FIRDI 009 TaxID=714197 RepID=UPI000E2779EA|nr:transmembrane transport protein [Nocardiopsis sp. FIRDI 009]
MSGENPAPGREVPEELRRALAAEVSLASRMRHVVVGVMGGCAAALIAVLWATEPQPLPTRTQAAFAGLIAIGLAWAVFAGWVLSRRRPLFARDRVLGGRIALAAALVTGVAGTALAAARAGAGVTLGIALVGLCLVIASGTALLRARSRHRELLRLRDALSHEDPRTP